MGKRSGNREVSRYEMYAAPAPKAAPGWSLATVREPARLFGANGVRIHPDGRLWISELVGEQLTAWDAANDVLSTVSEMGSELRGPDDIAFDAAGTVYAAETMNGRITGRRADGTYFVLVDDCPAVNGITIDPKTDKLYVDEMREGGRVLEVDKFTPNTVRVIAEGLDWLNALEMGPDGRLYLPQVFAGNVLAVDPESGAVETVLEGLALPTAVKFAPDGRLVVAESASGEITAVDLAGGERQCVVRTAPGIDNFDFDADGFIYVSNFVEASIARYVMDTGELDKGLSPGSFLGPYQIASAAEGFVAADHGSVCRVAADGAIERVSRLLIDQPFAAVGIAVLGETLVALSQAGELFRREDSGEWVKIYGSLADANAEYFAQDDDGVSSVGVGDGKLLAGLRHGDVVVLELDGTVRSRRASGLSTVTAVAGDADTIVASDDTAGTVMVLVKGQDLVAIDGFTRPQGVALLDGRVLVADQGTRELVRVGLDGSRRETIATDIPFGLPQSLADDGRRSSITVTADGSIILGCDGDGSLRRLTRDRI